MQMFKLIVAGGRDFADTKLFTRALLQLCEAGELKDFAVSIMSGMASGADRIAAEFAICNSVCLHRMPADWSKGRGTGYARNVDMARFADGVLAFWDGKSKGTKHMIETVQSMGKKVWVIRYD